MGRVWSGLWRMGSIWVVQRRGHSRQVEPQEKADGGLGGVRPASRAAWDWLRTVEEFDSCYRRAERADPGLWPEILSSSRWTQCIFGICDCLLLSILLADRKKHGQGEHPHLESFGHEVEPAFSLLIVSNSVSWSHVTSEEGQEGEKTAPAAASVCAWPGLLLSSPVILALSYALARLISLLSLCVYCSIDQNPFPRICMWLPPLYYSDTELNETWDRPPLTLGKPQTLARVDTHSPELSLCCCSDWFSSWYILLLEILKYCLFMMVV